MKLLLHICCAPCAIGVLDILKGNFKDIEGYFYNPNIHPPSEYKNRRKALKELEKREELRVEYPSYRMEEYFRRIVSKEESPERCLLCWRLRLEKTAEYAKGNGFDAFTTTLLISPYQNHEVIKRIAYETADSAGVSFFYNDFRKRFRYSQEKSKEMMFYRQKYCGCVFSELERVKIK